MDSSWNDKVIMQAGKSKTYTMPFVGHPEPTIQWSYNGSPELPESVTTSADTVEIKMALKNVKRTDRGVYKVTVSTIIPPSTYSIIELLILYVGSRAYIFTLSILFLPVNQ